MKDNIFDHLYNEAKVQQQKKHEISNNWNEAEYSFHPQVNSKYSRGQDMVPFMERM